MDLVLVYLMFSLRRMRTRAHSKITKNRKVGAREIYMYIYDQLIFQPQLITILSLLPRARYLNYECK